MNTRKAVSVAFVVSLIAGCAAPTASPSASPTPEPTPTASLSASAPPTPTPTSAPVITAGPLTVAGELSFGYDNFGGFPYGQAASVYGTNLAPAVTSSACGDAVIPMLFSNDPSTPPWGLFLKTNWNDPAVPPGTETVRAFQLVVQALELPTTPFGPVGPRGLRLSTPEATIEAMFPAEAALTTTRVTGVVDPIIDNEYDITERVFSIADVDGGPMIITTHDGYVATIMWGDPAYVNVQFGSLWCA